MHRQDSSSVTNHFVFYMVDQNK